MQPFARVRARSREWLPKKDLYPTPCPPAARNTPLDPNPQPPPARLPGGLSSLYRPLLTGQGEAVYHRGEGKLTVR